MVIISPLKESTDRLSLDTNETNNITHDDDDDSSWLHENDLK